MAPPMDSPHRNTGGSDGVDDDDDCVDDCDDDSSFNI